MKPLNLYVFAQVRGMETKSIERFVRLLTDRGEDLKLREREYQTIVSLVDELVPFLSVRDMEGFYYAFSIPQLGEEFDFLKISDDKVVAIELKSQHVGEQAIHKQLCNKKHYLSHLPGTHYYYTYVKGDKLLYTLSSDGTLIRCPIELLAKLLKNYGTFFSGNLDDKFRVSQFLVSPVNSPEKFLHGNYFLTPQQEMVESRILGKSKTCFGAEPLLFSVHGAPGTGKTLLLYHLAKKLSSSKKVCIIHCAPNTDEHLRLQCMWRNVKITIPKGLRHVNLDLFDVFVIDETQRIYTWQLDAVISHVQENNKLCILGIDPKQIMSRKEKNRNIDEHISHIHNIEDFKLSKRIRTNKEIAGFIEVMQDLTKAKFGVKYPNVSLVYANSYDEARKIIECYEEQGYTYISYTTSFHSADKIDDMPSDHNTHKVIGQEFDNVLIMLDDHFMYDETGKLLARNHPNPDYLFPKLFYQGITRVREKLMVLVIDNPQLFVKITSAIGCCTAEIESDTNKE